MFSSSGTPLRTSLLAEFEFCLRSKRRSMAWAKTSRQSRGYGAAWGKQRKAALERDKRLCQPCLALTPPRVTLATQVDHIKGKADGGTDDLANLQSICQDCHTTKTITDRGMIAKPRLTYGLDGWPI